MYKHTYIFERFLFFPAVFLVLSALLAVYVVQSRTVTRFQAAEAPLGTLAFPGATGFGSRTVGGRGGRVIYVTNLNDSGAGSFREAVSSSGSRVILFKVAGTINLLDDVGISNPYITIAGQSAPGEGIQIKGGMIKIDTHDVVIRYLKVRKGNPTGGNPADTDPISLSGNRVEIYNVIIDHSSLTWGTDIGGLAILTNSHDVTVQDTILGEGLYNSAHPESPHSHALNITQLNDSGYPTRITLYRNLLTSSDTRMPQMIQPANVDFVNNVLYNWGKKSAYGNPKSLNLINNYYIKGPLSIANYFWDLRVDADYPTQNDNAVYEIGNTSVGFIGVRSGPSSIYATSRFSPYSITSELTAEDAYNYVVSHVGATLPVRDAVDQRIIENVLTRTMTLPNGASNRFIDAADLVWPDLATGSAVVDSDTDGMGDAWEMQYFSDLSRGSATDSSADYDGDGYTDLEEFLNNTDPAVSDNSEPTVTPDATVTPPVEPSITEVPTDIPFPSNTPQPTEMPSPTLTSEPTPTPAIDTIAPAVSITAPLNNVKVKRSSKVTIKATATDNTGVAKVEFLVNGALLCTDTTAAYTCVWRVPSNINVQYILTARAYDVIGNVASHSITVTSK